jgi:two-component system, cell cycle sensor histidine kinase and response regulator CckA
MLTEITESKKAVDALRASEEFCRNLFDQANRQAEPYTALLNCFPDPVILYDIEGKVQYLNPAHSKLFGWTLEEAQGKRLNTLPDWDREATFSIISQILTEGAMNQCYETQRLSKQGQLIDVSVSGARFLDHNGNPAGMLVILHDITERKAINKAVKQSEDKYRQLVETTTDWVWTVDSQARHTFSNSAIFELLGYQIEEVLGSNAFPLMHPEDQQPAREMLKNCIEQGVGWDKLEIRWLHKDGSIRWFESSATPILDTEGHVMGFRGIDRDINDSKAAKAALERERNQAEMYLDIAGVMLVALNADGNITMMNRRGCEILGYREDEIIGKNWFDVCLPAELRGKVKSVFEKLMAGEIASAEYYENPVFTKDREQRILEFHNTVVHDESGRIVGIFSSGEDVTERKKAEEDLKSSETRYRQLADVTFEGIIFHDEGVLLQANDQFFQMFGYEPDELIGTQIIEKTLTLDSLKTVRAKIAERSTESYVAMGLRKDGTTFPIEVRARIRESEGKQIRATAIRDLSMLKNLEAQLLQAQKMEAIGTLAGGIAHDFNNLLQTVLGYSEFMLQRKKEGEPDYADLQKIYQAGKRGADLVKNLLTFSRRVDTHYLSVDLNQEITAVRGLLSRTIPKTININLHLGGNVEYIKADPSQIGQVLMNLAVNARDAMPDGGTLTIETTEIQLDEKYCNTYPEAKPGSYVLLTISDTGQGMDNETLSHIFEPFFSTKEVGKGTGLGLATVYGIVKQHQGRIICYSELGHGTTFKIYLPAIQTKKELETTTLEKDIAGGTETVLLVDDDDDIRDLVATFLIEFGYSVITAVNGKEAVEIY